MITYRWMQENDIPAVGDLARQIWDAHYIAIITQAQIDYMLARGYSPESLLRQIKEGQRFLLSTQDNAAVGFMSIGGVAAVENPLLRGAYEDAHFLHKFYIRPNLQGRGIGKTMLHTFLQQSPEIKRLRLQVARKNVNAWNFYLKQGFVIEREADFDIGDGYQMQDYVMEKIIT
jgi:ribosomal protein S18 acetylase RimI-like enzyme